MNNLLKDLNRQAIHAFQNKRRFMSDRVNDALTKHDITLPNQLYIHNAGPHVGLYAKAKWLSWLNEEEQLILKNMGVEKING